MAMTKPSSMSGRRSNRISRDAATAQVLLALIVMPTRKAHSRMNPNQIMRRRPGSRVGEQSALPRIGDCPNLP
ncbi:hypothetical protein [Blastomonas sp. UPD001]|uniref:hypothetical protein n=1 Tax=Blastomonas sp. UPD001 TaxID=2217673 RepID=UPI001E611F1B|nr:hypothetical protein [Blastomonas sp. UPD001]